MTPGEWAEVLGTVAAVSLTTIGAGVVVVLRAFGRIMYRMGQQDLQLEWQSRAIEGTAKKAGSDPPPRPKLATLPDPFEGLVEKARALKPPQE